MLTTIFSRGLTVGSLLVATSVERVLRIGSLLVLAVALFPLVAQAATFSVNRSDDDATATGCAGVPGDCSLRGAIIKANTSPGPDTLILPAGTYPRSSPYPTITDSLTITGAGSSTTVIDGSGQDTVLRFQTGVSGRTALVSDVTITGGHAISGSGGGVFNHLYGIVTLKNVSVTNNSVPIGGGGAGLANHDTMVVENSTVSGNHGPLGTSGGGIFNNQTLTLTNVTISGNRAPQGDGAGLFNGGQATLTNVTIYGNVGSGIMNHRPITLKNTIIANNFGGTQFAGNQNCGLFPSGVVISAGHNLDSGNTCGFTGTGDLVNTNPMLGPLQNNGGPTFTHALLSNSPAIDAGDNTGCPARDQRDFTRPVDGNGDGGAVCDIGAFEAGAAPAVALTVVIDGGPVSPTNSRDARFTFHASGEGSEVTFQCQLDGGVLSSCTSPATYTSVIDGSHTFAVRASDVNGGQASATFHWTVDATPPDTIIDSMPLDPVNSTSATFSFHATDPFSSLECELDGLGFNLCTSPATFTGLADGPHTFQVRAVDQLGNVDPTPAAFSWTVDTTAPSTVIDSAPSDPSRSNTATFSFHGSEPGTFACSLDGATPVTCESPVTHSGLGDSGHTFSVTETDTAGNQQAAAVTFAWDIDSTPPAVSCAATDTLWHGTNVTIACTASDGGSGLASAGDASFNLSTNVAAGVETATATTDTRSVCDVAGNCVPAGPVGNIRVDRKPPVITVSSPANGATYPRNSLVALTYACADAGAGVAACTGPAPSGTLIDTRTLGQRTLTFTATDRIGNAASQTVTFTIVAGGGSIPPADLAVSMTAPTTVAPSARITFVVTVRNLGPAPALGVTVTDRVPAAFVSAVVTQGTVTVAPAVGGTGTLSADLGTIAPGATARLTLAVTAPATRGTTVINIAGVTSGSPDPNAANNGAVRTTRTR